MMTIQKLFAPTLLIMAMSVWVSAGAQPAVAPAPAAPAATDMTDGEIRKIDKEAKKITIRHGQIKNLAMPGMTMVFQVKDPVMLDQVKVGDKIKFVAEKSGGAIVITALQRYQSD